MKLHSSRRALLRFLGASLLVGAASAAAESQQGTGGSCTRVSFGAWTPPLDWNRAGHPDSASRIGARLRGTRDSVFSGQATASGRDEMHWEESRGVRRLYLNPVWWPAGIVITFAGADSSADTLTGEAVAFVADGAVSPSRAVARLLRSGCPSRFP